MRRRRIPPEGTLPEEPLVNLTPLIDVVFVILISFMLIAPILNIDSIYLASGGPSSSQAVPVGQNRPLTISIRADNSIWFQGQRTEISELEQRLMNERRKDSSLVPQMIPDARCHFETYLQVKNIVEACGFERLDVVLRPS